ncbi:MAG: matrixin family metalloprotease [Bacteriovoracia bacterium]
MLARQRGSRKTRGVFLCVGVLSLFIGGIKSHATTFANLSLGELVDDSKIVVRGKTKDSYSQWDPTGKKTIYTYTPLLVEEVVKGVLPENDKSGEILIRQPGGTKDGISMQVPGRAEFSKNEDVVVLLGTQNLEDKSYDLQGLATGKYLVQTDDKGQLVLVNSLTAGVELYTPKNSKQEPPNEGVSRAQAYSSLVTYDLFKKIVKGDAPKDAKRLQFELSPSTPSKASQISSDEKDSQKDSKEKTDEMLESRQTKNGSASQSWIAVLGIALIVVSFFFLKGSKKGGKKKMRSFWPMILIGLLSGNANAFVFSTNDVGQVLSWPTPHPTFVMNWVNSRNLSYDEVFKAATNSLSRWQYIGTTSRIGFDYYQSDKADALTETAFDKRNSIFFSSKSTQKLGVSVIALTSTFSQGNNILEADMELNDDRFIFTTKPTDTTNDGGSEVFLENVLTHELGHAFGLAHSAVLQSSMVYLETPGHAKPSCDDRQAMGALYSESNFTQNRGTIVGKVQANSGNVFGAHVLAISVPRGTVVSGGISKSDGTFELPNLEPGPYVLMVEPFQATAAMDALCNGSSTGCSYGAVNSGQICNGSTQPFKRKFVEQFPGYPQIFSVLAGAKTDTGIVDVGNCTSIQQNISGVNNKGSAPELTNRVIVVDGNLGSKGKSHYFKVKNVRGKLSTRVLSYSLYSPVDPKIQILNSDGSQASGVIIRDDVFNNNSGAVNYDALAELNNPPQGDYLVQVTFLQNLSSSPERYPAGSVSQQIDTAAYYLLVVQIDPDESNVDTTAMPNNARCEALDNFPSFPDKGSPPPIDNTAKAPSVSAPRATNPVQPGGGCFQIVTDLTLQSLFASGWGWVLLMLLMWRGNCVRKKLIVGFRYV